MSLVALAPMQELEARSFRYTCHGRHQEADAFAYAALRMQDRKIDRELAYMPPASVSRLRRFGLWIGQLLEAYGRTCHYGMYIW